MKASQIRQKYKQILEQPQDEEQDSEDEWEIAYSQMAKQRKKRILTQSSPNQSISQNADPQQLILTLKQKLAQCISNNKLLQKQIEKLKKDLMIHNEDKIEWQQSTNQMNKAVQQQRNAYKKQLQKNVNLEAEIAELKAKLQELGMDRDLQQKQVDYYQNQLKHIKVDFQKQERQLKIFSKDYKQFEIVKRQNQYLKTDIERLSLLIEDCLKKGRVSGQLMERHFLGRPHRQFQYWFSHQLINEVEHFLKKSQVGYGNRQFTASLVKFIDKYVDRACKQSQAKSKSTAINQARPKDNLSLKKYTKGALETSSYKKHSYNLSNVREQNNLRSITSSFWRSTESRLAPFNSSTIQINSKAKQVCQDILNQFKSIVFQLLLQKEVKRKKIKKLIDSMSNSVLDAIEDTHDNQSLPSHKNVFGPIRLETDVSTTLLK